MFSSAIPSRVAIAAMFVAVSPVMAVAQSADAAYDRLVRAWSATQTLEAAFEQQITNPLLGRTATSRGLFQQQRPGKVSITFSEPAGDRIVGDGKALWVYLPSSTPGQVLKLPADADGAIVADLLGQLLDTPKRAFAITGGDAATVSGRSTRRVLLTPRSAESVPFKSATLWIDDKEPRPVRVRVIDGQGIDRMITLTSWRPDTPLPKDAFVFRTPKGVKVSTKLPGS